MANTVNYFEIGSPDPQAARAFYGGLFDWDIGQPSMPSGYSSVEGSAGGCGIPPPPVVRVGRSSTSRSMT